jgi:cytochrome c oxidase subunit 4
MSSTPHHMPPHHADEHAHPGPRQYVMIAIILAIITAIEVAVYYIDALAAVEAYILIFLSTLKFILVVAFYMHLKFDNRLFTYFFCFGLGIAAGVIFAFLALFDRLV